MSEYVYQSRGEPLANERGEIYLAHTGEIIRCADCAYRDPERELYGKGWCRTNVRYVRDKDYCAWAEPKDETLALPRREC